MSRRLSATAVAVATLAFSACSDEQTPPPLGPDVDDAAVDARGGRNADLMDVDIEWIVLAKDGRDLSAVTAAASAEGAEVLGSIPQIGVALVRGGQAVADAVGAYADVAAVFPNAEVSLVDPDPGLDSPPAALFASPPASGDDDFFYDLQWGHAAMDVADAWNEGYRGAGVRIAILDSGIDPNHTDLAPNVNLGLSTSFVPGEDFDNPPGGHGTHVAGIAAAADNAYGVIGVAPEAEIVAVKVLSAATGTGSVFGALDGLVYAADIGADVANLSLGSVWYHSGFDIEVAPDVFVNIPARVVQFVYAAHLRAVQYAHSRGVTIVAAAGNDAVDGDKDKDKIHLPSDVPHVIAVSATTPIGWAADFGTSLDELASYSNFGQSVIDFAAPGGDFVYPGNEGCVLVIARPCWVFDGVFSTVPGGWAWASGTSMASPHVAGVAALIVGKNGGDMDPAHVEAALRAGAEDLGKPGNDDVYGAGRVNAFRSLMN